jgi:hypothetical protein
MPETRAVTLREMLAAMSKSPDTDVFRWFQDSEPLPDGSIGALDSLYVTVGQVRSELGLK